MKRITSAFALFLLFAASAASPAELRILAPAAVQSALSPVLAGFERQTQSRVVFEELSAEEVVQRAMKADTADVVIVPNAQMNALAQARRIMADTRRTLGRAPGGDVVLAIAALSNGDHEDDARSLTAYLSLPETIEAMRRRGISAP